MPSIPHFRKVTGSHYKLVCVHCKSPITQTEKVYVDDTGGDVCCADIFAAAGVNGKHTPYASFEIHPTNSHIEL